jgi:hypothetical protein
MRFKLLTTPTVAFVALLLLVFWLAATPVLIHGEASYFLFPDAQEQTYAWWQKLASGWQAGYLPLWDANTVGGHSLAGEMQAAVFYPLTWLWLALFSRPEGMPLVALEMLLALHFVIAAVSMWALLRHWGLGLAASVAGALCFSLFGPVAERAAAQPNIFQGLCWLPLAVLFASQHMQTRRLRYSFLAGAVIGLQALAGHAQPAFHTALICAVLCVHQHWRQGGTRGERLLAIARSGAPMLLAAILVALPQWILTFQYLSDAYRWVGAEHPIAPGKSVPYAVFSRQHIIAPAGFLALLDPWAFRADDANTPFLSAVGALLAAWMAGWWVTAKARRPALPWSRHAPWLLALAALSMLAVIGYLTPLPYVLRKLPLVGQIRELGRYVILFHFVACVFAAAGVDWLRSNASALAGSRHFAFLLAGAVVVLALASWRHWLSAPAQISLAAALLALAPALLPRLPAAVPGMAIVAAIVVSAQLYQPLRLPYIGGRTTAPQAFAAQPLLQRVEREYGLARILIDDDAGLPKNYANAHRLQSKLGYSATMYRPYFDFIDRDWSADSEIDDLLNIRYRLSRARLALPLLAEDSRSGLHLYARPSAYPRVLLASAFRGPLAERRLPPEFRLLHYDDHEMRFSLRLDRPERVIVSEVWYPGWCAEVDGAAVDIGPARLGELATPLRALSIPAGRHDVRMAYRPFAELLGACEPR